MANWNLHKWKSSVKFLMRLGKVTGTRKICSVKMVFKTAHQNSPWTCKGCRVDAWLGYEKYWKTSEKTFSNPRNGVPAKSVRSDRKIEIWKTSLKPLTLKDKVFNPELNTTPLSLTKNYCFLTPQNHHWKPLKLLTFV